MPFSFSAKMYKTGINWCVDVPVAITEKMKAMKGYIPVLGKINGYPFIQTLVPVKNAPHRLFVNGIMLKGSKTKAGDTVNFIISQDTKKREEAFPPELKKALTKNKLTGIFNTLSASRKKEILRYLNNLKTQESLLRNVEKVIAQLKNKDSQAKGFLRALNSVIPRHGG